MQREKSKLPGHILNAPVLLPGLEVYMTAFDELKTGGQLIDWLTIDRYCQVHGILGETRELMFHYVRQLDKTLERLVTKKYRTPQNGSKL